MKKIFTITLFIFSFGNILSQTPNHWNLTSIPNNTTGGYYGYSLSVIDSLHVVLTPRYSYISTNIYKTTNGGQTWTSHVIDSTMYTLLHETEFVDKDTGYIVGGTDYGNWNVLLKTINGGVSWQNMNVESSFSNAFPTQITEVSFITSQIGFIARYGENKIYRTTNGGVSFAALDLPKIPNNLYSSLTEMRFVSPYVGFVIRVTTADNKNSTSEILKTTDGGNSWSIVNTAKWQDLEIWEKKDKIQFVNHLQGFAIAGKGVLKKTQDGGDTWHDENLPLNTVTATDFYFVNNACGYIALEGNIYRTNDAGTTWSLQTTENNLKNVDFVGFASSNFGYALNNESTAQGQVIFNLLNTNQQPATALSTRSFVDNNLFIIYPNPAIDVLNIQNTNALEISFIHLLDTSGKIIKTYKNNLEILDVSNVSSGNYLIFIQTPKQKVVKKIIIK